jgi:hypothetical protein
LREGEVVSEWWFVRKLKAGSGDHSGLLNLVFFFYLVRVDVRSRLR